MSDERVNYEIESPWVGEHLFRYLYVSSQCDAKDVVLDLACGFGDGSKLLAKSTVNSVIGIDLSEAAISKASAGNSVTNLCFYTGDGTSLKFPDGYFSKIISFETIEHTPSYRDLLSELFRVLKPGGTLFLSTPNKAICSPGECIINPFHTQEFLYEDLFLLFRGYPCRFNIYGQVFTGYQDHRSIRSQLTISLRVFLQKKIIRKLPLKVRNVIVSVVSPRGVYPESDEFSLVFDKASVEKAPTFFVICKKKDGKC